MYAILTTSEHAAEARHATGNGEISFEKIGNFNTEKFLQHCMTIATLPIHCLVLDIECTSEEAFREGMQAYKQLRPSTKIIIIATQRPAIDGTVARFLKDGYDVRTVSALEEQSDVEDEENGKIAGAINRLTTALNQPVIMDSPDALVMDLPNVPVQEKIIVQQKIIGSVVIGIIGVEPRAGCTHQAILIANYLNSQGKKVGLIEANESGDYARIEQLYEGVKDFVGKDRSFSIQKTDYYKKVAQTELTSLMSEKYDYIILDIGNTENMHWLEEFARADLQIIVGAGIDWRQHKNISLSEKHKRMDQSRWKYIIPFTDSVTVNDIKKQHSANTVQHIPYHPDPYTMQRDSNAELNKLLSTYIGQKKNGMPRGVIYSALVVSFITIIVLIVLLLIK